ncbi:hypothetical protein KA005_01500 [bacterium]|nr:hypothetical protein [bacterium]
MKTLIPRMAIRLDNLGRWERDHRQVLEICKDALKPRYRISVDYNKEIIYIGNKSRKRKKSTDPSTS